MIKSKENLNIKKIKTSNFIYFKKAEAVISIKELCRKYGKGDAVFDKCRENMEVWKPQISNFFVGKIDKHFY